MTNKIASTNKWETLPESLALFCHQGVLSPPSQGLLGSMQPTPTPTPRPSRHQRGDASHAGGKHRRWDEEAHNIRPTCTDATAARHKARAAVSAGLPAIPLCHTSQIICDGEHSPTAKWERLVCKGYVKRWQGRWRCEGCVHEPEPSISSLFPSVPLFYPPVHRESVKRHGI